MAGVEKQGKVGAIVSTAAFRSRMEHQCRHIDKYRRAVLKQGGRVLSQDEAAREWIERYAANFDGCSDLQYE